MKIGYLIAGLIFLANPNIGIVDFLPDFFGYLLIIHALSVSSVIIPYWKEAVRGATRMMVISALKLLCIPLLLKDISSLPVLLSFSFAIVELIFLIPTVGKLFEGLFYAGMRYDIPSIYSYRETQRATKDPSSGRVVYGKVKIEHGPKVKRATITFLIFRAIVSVLPNLSDLQLFEHSGKVTDGYAIRFSDFNNLFAVLAFTIGLVGSVIWMASFIPYFVRISKDTSWDSNFVKICDGLKNEPDFSDRLAARRVVIFFVISVCTSIFIPIDGINYLIGIIPAVFLITAAVLYSKYDRKAYFLSIPALGCAVCSVMEFSARRSFFTEFNYEPEAALWIPNAHDIYLKVSLYTCLTRMFLLASLMVMFVLVYRKWNQDFENPLKTVNEDIYSKEIHNSIGRKYRLLAALSVPLFVMTAFEPWLVLYVDFISVLLSMLSIVWVLFTVIIALDMMKERYSLEVDETNT